MRKPLKIIGLGLIGLVVAFIGYVIYGFAFLSYKEDRLTVGCEKEFCIGQSKVDVEAQFENKFSFDSNLLQITKSINIHPYYGLVGIVGMIVLYIAIPLIVYKSFKLRSPKIVLRNYQKAK